MSKAQDLIKLMGELSEEIEGTIEEAKGKILEILNTLEKESGVLVSYVELRRENKQPIGMNTQSAVPVGVCGCDTKPVKSKPGEISDLFINVSVAEIDEKD